MQGLTIPLMTEVLKEDVSHVPKGPSSSHKCFADLDVFLMQGLCGLLQKGTLLVPPARASVSPPAQPGYLGCPHRSAGKIDLLIFA